MLRRENWKMIEIISKKDLLPQDDIIIELVDKAKQYLKNNHSYFCIDIDNNKLKCKEYEIDYDFGKLRRIYQKTLDNFKQLNSIT
jgi:hypothetical protein